MRTMEQLDQYMDLFILPNTTNSLETHTAAFGSIYFDDGVNVTKNVSMIEMTYSHGDKTDMWPTIHFTHNRDGYRHPNNARQE